MAEETQEVYKVDATVTVGGTAIPVADVTITNGMNTVPTAVALLPPALAKEGSNITVFTDDPTKVSTGDAVYEICKKAQDNDDDVSISVVVTALGGAAFDSTFEVGGWKITNVALQPQSRVSPGGVSITAQHPMCELLNAAGFFHAPGADYERILDEKEKSSTNIIEAADAMLEEIEKVINSEGYTQLKLGVTEDYEQVKKQAGVRLSKWLECDSGASKWPFSNIITSKDYAKACSTAFALNFVDLPRSVPFEALLALCNQLGLFIAPSFSGSEKAKIKVLNPWKRRGVDHQLSTKIYSTQVTRDSDPISGVRLLESPRDTMIVSTLSSAKPVDDKTKAIGGEIVYCFGSKGRIINGAVPSIVYRIFSKLQKTIAANTVSTEISNKVNNSPRASNTTWEDPKTVLKSIGLTSSEAVSALDQMQAAVAKMMFICLHRRTQKATVTKPFIEGDIPEIGSFSTFKAGTGGDNAEGMVTSVMIQASCTRGTCTITIGSSYCGDKAKMGSNGDVLINDMWGDAEEDGDEGGGQQ
jgi:hypothetical protein